MTERSELIRQLSIGEEARNETSSRWKWPLLAATVLALAGIAYWLWGNSREVPLVEVVSAEPASAGAAAAGGVLDGSGYVVARRQATVSSKTTGKVIEVLLEEGMRVQENQILARLDPSNVQAQLALAQAELNGSRTRVRESEVALAEAMRELNRQQNLIARKLTAQQALEQAQASVDTQRARVSTARSAIAVSQASLRLYQQQIDDTIIRAPFSGMVIAKAAQPGEMISPISAGGGFTRTGIGTIVDMDSLEVEIDVNESFIAKVRAKQPAQITLNSYPDEIYPGAVIAIIPTADRTKATVKVRVGFTKLDERVLPDMGARVRFLGNASPASAPAKGVLIPAGAMQDGQVWIYQDGKISGRKLSSAQTLGAKLRIESGLSAGEQVLSAPSADLRDGMAVRIK